MKLNEIHALKDQSDYQAGDESNPRSPYYDPSGRIGRQPRRSGIGDSDTGPSAADKAEDSRMRDVRSGIDRQKAATNYTEGTGKTPQGKNYTLVVTFSDPVGEEVNALFANRWKENNQNIYTKVVGQDTIDGNVRLFVDATPRSLVWNSVR